MQRRLFFRKLFGAALAGLAAPRVGALTAEPVVIFDPMPLPPGLSGTYMPMVGGRYAGDQLMFPMEGGFYRAGDTFKVRGGPQRVRIGADGTARLVAEDGPPPAGQILMKVPR